jgi:hypothetical protein
MKSVLPVKVSFDTELVKGAPIKSTIPIGTWWEFEHIRAGKVIDAWEQKNVTTTEGRNHMLNSTFHGVTQITTWYICIFTDNHTCAVGDTYATPGYTEANANVDEATRSAYTVVDSTASAITNAAAKASYTANAGFTAYGAGLVGGTAVNAQNKADTGTAGAVLFALAQFAATKSLVDDDILVITCAITLSDV